MRRPPSTAPAGWQRFSYITLPMMRNIISITVLFSLIVTFANFDIVRILTAGGPIDQTQVFATWSFLLGIQGGDIALGAAVSLFMFPILAIAAVFILRGHQPARKRGLTAGLGCSRGSRADRPGPIPGSFAGGPPARSATGPTVFLCLFVVFFLTPPRVYVHHLAQGQCGGGRGHRQSVVGLPPDAIELQASLLGSSEYPDLFPQFRGSCPSSSFRDHHADQRAGGVCPGAYEVLGLDACLPRACSSPT